LRCGGLLLAFFLLLMTASPLRGQEITLAGQLRSLAHVASEGVDAAKANDTAAMQHEYEEAHDLWESFEVGVREQNPNAYVAL